MYYNLTSQAGTKETGPVYPQGGFNSVSLAAAIRYHGLDTVSLAAAIIHHNRRDESVKLEFELAKRAKLTDLLGQATISASGHLISARFRTLLDKFRISSPHYYPVMVKTKNMSHEYSFVRISPVEMDYIDFPNSAFQWEHEFEDGAFVKIRSYEEYVSLDKSRDILSAINVKQLRLKKHIPYDMFSIDLSNARECIISEHLKSALIDSHMTGMCISDFSVITT